LLEQAREAADLAGLVLLAALDDQVVGVLAGDDLLGLHDL
jgi:arginine repressor